MIQTSLFVFVGYHVGKKQIWTVEFLDIKMEIIKVQSSKRIRNKIVSSKLFNEKYLFHHVRDKISLNFSWFLKD